MVKSRRSGGNKQAFVITKNSKAMAFSRDKMELTNDYGNTVTFALDDNGFDQLWSALWEFVKDRQH